MSSARAHAGRRTVRRPTPTGEACVLMDVNVPGDAPETINVVEIRPHGLRDAACADASRGSYFPAALAAFAAAFISCLCARTFVSESGPVMSATDRKDFASPYAPAASRQPWGAPRAACRAGPGRSGPSACRSRAGR